MSAFIPVQQSSHTLGAAPAGTVPNFAGSPNQGAYIPVQEGTAGVPGYQVEKRGVKGHHTVLHPIVYAQPPPPQPQPQPQVIVVQQPVPVIQQVASPAPSPQPQQPINIKVNNQMPEQQGTPMTINNSQASPQPQQQAHQPTVQPTQPQIHAQPQVTQPQIHAQPQTTTAPMVTQH